MTEDEKVKYKAQLSAVIDDCLDNDGSKHGLLVVANSVGVLSLYSINVAESDLPFLIGAASQVICARAPESMN